MLGFYEDLLQPFQGLVNLIWTSLFYPVYSIEKYSFPSIFSYCCLCSDTSMTFGCTSSPLVYRLLCLALPTALPTGKTGHKLWFLLKAVGVLPLTQLNGYTISKLAGFRVSVSFHSFLKQTLAWIEAVIFGNIIMDGGFKFPA